MDAQVNQWNSEQFSSQSELKQDGILTWAVVATIKEPQKETEQFIAHYRSLGAKEIFVFFDDPEDLSFETINSVGGVIATKCSAEYWQDKRPHRHEWRQKANAQRAYRDTECDWIIHLDADEFIYCPNGVCQLLAGLETHQTAARIVPAEPLIHPRSGRIKAYHSPLPGNTRGKQIGKEAFGDVYPLLAKGMLSHSEGKYFLQTGLPGDPISIHRPRLSKNTRIATLPKNDILLLHHHAVSEDIWIEKFQLRLNTTYAAQFRDNKRNSGSLNGKGLNGYLKGLAETGEDGLRQFFRKTHHIDHSVGALRRGKAVHRPQIWLDQKRDDLFANTQQICSDFRVEPSSGRLQARAEFLGIKMIIEPDFNRTEHALALGMIDEEDELRCIRDLTACKTVRFWDIGANTGIYSLVVAATANADSFIQAFEPHPRMIEAIKRNVALNGFKNISIEPIALGETSEMRPLHVFANLGKCTLLPRKNSKHIDVRVEELSNYAAPQTPYDISLMKIDVVGAEPLVLKGFFKKSPPISYPDYILFEHAREARWDTTLNQVIPSDVYDVERVFKFNTLLRHRLPSS